MKAKAGIFFVLLLMLTVSASAVEWNGKTGIGIRGPVFMPLFSGNNNSLEFEPYGMGWDATLDIKRGLTENLVINLTIGYGMSYDDIYATDDQSFTMNSADSAWSKLTGIFFGLTANYYFRADQKLQPYLLAGLGVDMWTVKTELEAIPEEKAKFTDLSAKVGAGLHIWLKENFSLDLQGKLTFGQGNLSKDEPAILYTDGDWSSWDKRPFTAYFEPSIGISYYFGGKDTDKDGVSDRKDQCPGTPLGAIVDEAGCPLDEDGDGVYDGLDQCAATPKGAKVNAVGCPLDSDKDGVYDGLDLCEGTPEGVKVYEDGCPVDTDKDKVPDYLDKEINTPAGAKVDKNGVGIDSDKDGVYDGIDKCPDTPAGCEVDPKGCAYDWDQDGVPDSVDACLRTPRGIIVDATGCPLVEKITETIVLHINFASGAFTPTKEAEVVLDSIYERIYSYPETKVEVQGFTDNAGAEDFNLELSQKRADGVKAYLVGKGIEPERISTQGFGENPDKFIDTNDTPEGRFNNRRVEIKAVYETEKEQ